MIFLLMLCFRQLHEGCAYNPHYPIWVIFYLQSLYQNAIMIKKARSVQTIFGQHRSKLKLRTVKPPTNY